jgi:type 1 fimbria pilin
MKNGAMLLAILSGVSLFACTPEVLAHDGTVNVTGTIKNNTCTVAPDSQNQTVRMGQVASKQFYQAGDTTPIQRFAINLENCSAALSGVSITFNGTPDEVNSHLLSIGSGTGKASGIGIAILDKDKILLPVSIPSQQYPLSPDSTSAALIFYAQYMATGSQVGAGEANASATFVLSYA